MCTVSWISEPGGYHLLCNRDEKKDRAPALAPRLHQRGWVRFISPVDPQFGGSWIAVNEFGVSVCLLNGARDSARVAPPARGGRSRGLVVRDLIWAASASECALRLNQLDLSGVAPFTVLLLEPDVMPIASEWNGETLEMLPSPGSCLPLTSSSLDASGARAVRSEELRKLAASAGVMNALVLEAFHRSHGESPDAYSPCMHRADAETVSFSHVVVKPGEIRFSYRPAAPCKPVAGEETVLRLH